MLPKVATHILHHTSRAVTAVQNQTGYTIRNVLQLQTQGSGTPATTGNGLGGYGSSNWGSTGAGPGGAKYHAGSRFYSGYSGAGRAVTQANSTAHDSQTSQSDDSEEFTFQRGPMPSSRKSRTRSHSVSVEGSGRQERAENLGVLKTIQMHARGKHVFAPASNTSTTNDLVPSSDNVTVDSQRPVLVRRNSTSASESLDSSDGLPPPLPIQTQSKPLPSTDPSAPQTSTPPTPESLHQSPVHENSTSEIYRQLKHARDSRDAARVLALVQNLRSSPIPPRTAEFNMALEALHETRKAGEPLNIMLDVYNEMIAKSVVPNTRTYLVLILALTDRDHEVYKGIMSLEVNVKREFRDERKLEGAQARIDMLRAENNFGSAMSLFEAACAIAWNRTIIPLNVYANLIRSCAQHSNVDAAIHVFAHLERKSDIPPSAIIYSNLISVYSNIGDLQGAKEVFNEYKDAVRQGRITWAKSTTKADMMAKTAHLTVWNRMIQAHFRCEDYVGALSLLEQMMDAPVSSAPSTEFKAEEMGVPAPSSSTFTKIIAGFIQAGDLTSALSWFNKLLEQDSTARHPHESSTIPPKPDQIAWTIVLDALASAGNVAELNRLFAIMVENAGRDGLEVTATHRIVLFEANMHYLDTTNPTKAEAQQTLDFLTKHLLGSEASGEAIMKVHVLGQKKITDQLIDAYIQHGNPLKAFNVLSPIIVKRLESLRHMEKFAHQKPAELHRSMMELQDTMKGISTHVLKPEFVRDLPVPFEDVLKVVRLSDAVNYLPEGAVAQHYLYAYALQKVRGEVKELRMRDWELLALASTSLELPNDDSTAPMFHDHAGTASLLEDFKTFGVDLQRINKGIVRRIIQALSHKHQPEYLQELFARLGPDYEKILTAPENNLHAQQSPVRNGAPLVSEQAFNADASSTAQGVIVDQYHSRYVEQFFPNNVQVTPLMAYSRFEEGVNKGIYPVASTIGRLINALGRLKEMEKVRVLYNAAHLVMSTLEPESHWQSAAWFQIEDQMIIACAHAGEMEAAFEHRARIAEQGGIPSADAFGALIECVKDTTDDTSNAMALYQESRAVGCTPNVYMFNTIISKLAKARKADFALELFQEMKATRIRPSSITYGAVVAACARVGDAASAEQLFLEMSSQKNFKPRIPPFNTMMQLYTHTKPDRERVIYYYNALLEARIQPSAHTYKLLLDAYGTIEPVDKQSMENVFNQLEHDRRVHIQGAHWASLINAYGCVQKDLGKAIEVFESIATHPSTSRSSAPMPDAVAYEALVNVLVIHRRMDLIPQYMDRLHASGIHLTAYIANLLIKGHAAIGDIAQARVIFEGLQDPPQGMAATSNHVPHEPSVSVPTAGPCLREPSTWEAMVRAELGNGNRDNAVALLERLQARHYPPAVYNRISGIMLDDSVAPWAAS